MSASLKANEPSMEEILASIRRIIADDNGTPVEAASPEPEVAEDTDVLDLATIPAEPAAMDEDDIEFREVAEPLLVVPSHLLQPEEPPPAPEPSPPPAPEPLPLPRASEPVSVVAPPRIDESLLSDTTNAAVASAFGALTSTIITQNARTLEDLVKDMLRPMLKGWLDENLPALVERLVKAEIERVTRGPRG